MICGLTFGGSLRETEVAPDEPGLRGDPSGALEASTRRLQLWLRRGHPKIVRQRDASLRGLRNDRFHCRTITPDGTLALRLQRSSPSHACIALNWSSVAAGDQVQAQGCTGRRMAGALCHGPNLGAPQAAAASPGPREGARLIRPAPYYRTYPFRLARKSLACCHHDRLLFQGHAVPEDVEAANESVGNSVPTPGI
jgi:hypothetical protein